MLARREHGDGHLGVFQAELGWEAALGGSSRAHLAGGGGQGMRNMFPQDSSLLRRYKLFHISYPVYFSVFPYLLRTQFLNVPNEGSGPCFPGPSQLPQKWLRHLLAPWLPWV